MNNKKYILHSDGLGEELAVDQVAALFDLTLSESGCDKFQFSADTLWIEHHFHSESQGIASLCEVFYYSEQGLRYAARRDYITGGGGMRERRWLVRRNLYYLLCEVSSRNPSPWGILSGVRPTKLVHRMFDSGYLPATVEKSLIKEYALQPNKARLVTGVALRQRPFLLGSEAVNNKVGIYIGIPFCPTRCLYCSFPSYPLPGTQAVQAFLAALFEDMQSAKASLIKHGLTVQTVYIGGGTPTSLNAADFALLLGQTAALFSAEAEEFTVEAGRPDSLSDEKIKLLAEYGVNRVSVNPQTMQEKTLKLIGRMHTVQDIIGVFGKMRMCNIPVVNMDVIAGLPGETPEDMADTLRQIEALSPDNLTVHTLALKRGSRLSEADGYLLPDAAATADMLDLANKTAVSLGMQPYYLYRQKKMAGNLENIGYSLPGKECLYNIQIIEERQTILGIGPSATTKVMRPSGLTNFYQPKDLSTYINTLHERLQKRDALLTASLGR